MSKKIYKILLVLFFCSIFLTASGFCEYADLVGKWVKVQGPLYWDNIALSPEKPTCDKFLFILLAGDEEAYERAMDSFKVVRVKNPISALVLDVLVSEGKAKITVLEGLYRGRSGWVPLSWIVGLSNRPAFSKK